MELAVQRHVLERPLGGAHALDHGVDNGELVVGDGLRRQLGRERLHPRLIESLRDAFDACIRFDATAGPDPDYFARAHAEHEAIARALHHRAANGARKPVETHLRLNAEHFGVSIG